MTTSPSIQHVHAGLSIAQSLLLLWAVVWIGLEALPSPDPEAPNSPPVGTAVGSSPSSAPVPVFDEEALAVRDLLRHVDDQLGIEKVLRHRPDLDEVLLKRSAAHQCASFKCPALEEWFSLVRRNGGKVPTTGPWTGDSRPLAQNMLVQEYVDLVERQILDLSKAANRSDLLVDAQAVQAARTCSGPGCPALQTYTERAAVSLNALGRTLPPVPQIGSSGVDRPPRRADKQPSSKRPPSRAQESTR